VRVRPLIVSPPSSRSASTSGTASSQAVTFHNPDIGPVLVKGPVMVTAKVGTQAVITFNVTTPGSRSAERTNLHGRAMCHRVVLLSAPSAYHGRGQERPGVRVSKGGGGC
jgi:hypothetical protein